jgi:hypothetical protein
MDDGARPLPISLTLDGAPVASSTVFRPAGAHVLTISTTIPRPDLPLTLHSTYVGAPGAPTHVIHLQQGPAGYAAQIEGEAFADDHEPELCMVVFRPGDCAADHTLRLIGWLNQRGHNLQVDLSEAAIAALQAVH